MKKTKNERKHKQLNNDYLMVWVMLLFMFAAEMGGIAPCAHTQTSTAHEANDSEKLC